MTFYRRCGKRTTDLVVAAALIAATSPLQLTVAAISIVVQGRPILFRQTRAGLDGEPFVLVKFRTMLTDETRDRGSRVTPLGRVLRQTSLDELPQLWNVLRGEMSMVGPRPLHVRYVERYSSRQLRRLEVRPGITGLAQVAGRNAVPWEDRLELDVQYVESLSILVDLKIVVRTFQGLFGTALSRRHGVETAPSCEFMGVGGALPS